MNLILCGIQKSGKTTIGKLLASALQCPFIDTDRLVESAYTLKTTKKLSCRDICLHEGQKAFRLLENEQIVTLKGTQNAIISIGGGSLSHQNNLAILKDLGVIIYLKTPTNILLERVMCDGTPSYLDSHNPLQSFHNMIATRTPIFENNAHVIIDTDTLNEQEVVHAILTQTRHLRCH